MLFRRVRGGAPSRHKPLGLQEGKRRSLTAKSCHYCGTSPATSIILSVSATSANAAL